MKAELNPVFGEVPPNADNLEIVGPFMPRFEEWNQATVWPGSGVLRRSDGAVETEAIWIPGHLAHCGDYHSKWSWLPEHRRGRFFNLSLFWWGNYYHWCCDVLARLHRVLPRLEPDVQIILPAHLTAWQKRSLELIGLPLNRCVEHSGRRPWKVERLVYVSPVAMTGDHEPVSLQWVRDAIRRGVGLTSMKPGWRKLYLDRKNAVARNVVNEAELLPLLQSRGFEIVDCGRLSFDEQVQLFAEAACVAGPHGAAFTNILWSPPGLKVLEIFEPGSVRRCYWSMCQALGHRHACGIGKPVRQSGPESNLQVPVQAFAEALDKLCPLGTSENLNG